MTTPDGKETKEWIEIRSSKCKAFKRAIYAQQKQLENLKGANTSFDDLEEKTIELLSILIVGWSFEDECNEENKKLLLSQNPALADTINDLATEDELFIKGESKNSNGSPKTRKR